MFSQAQPTIHPFYPTAFYSQSQISIERNDIWDHRNSESKSCGDSKKLSEIAALYRHCESCHEKLTAPDQLFSNHTSNDDKKDILQNK